MQQPGVLLQRSFGLLFFYLQFCFFFPNGVFCFFTYGCIYLFMNLLDTSFLIGNDEDAKGVTT